MTTLNEITIPQADRYDIWFCGACPNAHLLFFDKNNVPICQAVLGATQAETIGAAIRKNDPSFRQFAGRPW